ncbi:MAG: hypothetical protein U5K79_22080 [Cyclobacteriaceae bacterium]|nr:hypothetical protein [Cyclobacteriaceae bacterium]
MSKAGKRVMSSDTMRIGKRYCVINYGEMTTFRVLSAEGINDFAIKDIHSLEIYRFSSLTAYGQGEDYELFEL